MREFIWQRHAADYSGHVYSHIQRASAAWRINKISKMQQQIIIIV
jgi:hypothetical protein